MFMLPAYLGYYLGLWTYQLKSSSFLIMISSLYHMISWPFILLHQVKKKTVKTKATKRNQTKELAKTPAASEGSTVDMQQTVPMTESQVESAVEALPDSQANDESEGPILGLGDTSHQNSEAAEQGEEEERTDDEEVTPIIPHDQAGYDEVTEDSQSHQETPIVEEETPKPKDVEVQKMSKKALMTASDLGVDNLGYYSTCNEELDERARLLSERLDMASEDISAAMQATDLMMAQCGLTPEGEFIQTLSAKEAVEEKPKKKKPEVEPLGSQPQQSKPAQKTEEPPSPGAAYVEASEDEDQVKEPKEKNKTSLKGTYKETLIDRSMLIHYDFFMWHMIYLFSHIDLIYNTAHYCMWTWTYIVYDAVLQVMSSIPRYILCTFTIDMFRECLPNCSVDVHVQDTAPLCSLPPDLSADDSLQTQIEESIRRLGQAKEGKDVEKNLLKASKISQVSFCFLISSLVFPCLCSSLLWVLRLRMFNMYHGRRKRFFGNLSEMPLWRRRLLRIPTKPLKMMTNQALKARKDKRAEAKAEVEVEEEEGKRKRMLKLMMNMPTRNIVQIERACQHTLCPSR